jgi:hypothetical protein
MNNGVLLKTFLDLRYKNIVSRQTLNGASTVYINVTLAEGRAKA